MVAAETEVFELKHLKSKVEILFSEFPGHYHEFFDSGTTPLYISSRLTLQNIRITDDCK